ncbi:acetyl-CoA synthetase-like protein [Suillus fuscotomentosus]|uniref:Acetyl-CoA synthetase-like protein n=1 Tax=Suillus fuscotomentosus TaxID=1912939 RepID=A0AAD4E9X7_9AGAM|nr:acetyl-CoA synthetase-like protein [Suillus fuscotomentosus]KAG1902364.1 acetyl-CoA synthetase-like protein [Suillus fuscotomentosus]
MASLGFRQSVKSALQTAKSASTRRNTGQCCSLTEEILGKHAHRPALICTQERPRAHGGPPSRNLNVINHLAWDFDEFDKHIRALARGLVAMGVRKGDRVAVLMGNNSGVFLYEALTQSLQWACASIGAILVTLNPAYRLNELVETINLVGVTHLFTVPRIRTSNYIRMLSDAFPGLCNSTPGNIQEPGLPSLRNLVVVSNIHDTAEWHRETCDVKSITDWRETLIWREDTWEQRHIEESVQSQRSDEVINLQFTSGTTGAPKAVSLTHTNLLNNGISIGDCMRLGPDDVLFIGNLAAWSYGSCVVYPSEIYDPKAIVDSVAQHRCTALHGVPTHFLGVLAEVQKRQDAGEKLDLSCPTAGSPIPIDLMRQLIEKLNLVDLSIAYGMSDPVSFQTTPADPIIKRVETVGRVQPHVKATIIDQDGHVIPVGKPGELCIAGYLVQKGYWEDEEQTQKAMRADPNDPSTIWMHTGDEGIMDEEGYLKSKSDIIIRGGENLFPVQIENALTAHPSIREAAVVSVRDTKYGEVVGAWIVREPGTNMSREDVRRTVAENMNPQNAPAWVWFVGEDGAAGELPKTASGKVMKHVLRKWSAEFAQNAIGTVGGK